MNSKTRSVLLVDDEKDFCDFISKFLIKKGYSCDTCQSGTDALKYFDPNKHNIALIDLRMPGLDGLSVIKSIKDISEQTVCILITGYADLESALQGYQYGCDDFLVKPLSTLNLLPETIERCIKRLEKCASGSCYLKKDLHFIDDVAQFFSAELKSSYHKILDNLNSMDRADDMTNQNREKLQEVENLMNILLEQSDEIHTAFHSLKSILSEKKCNIGININKLSP